jgi:hypothetical protein
MNTKDLDNKFEIDLLLEQMKENSHHQNFMLWATDTLKYLLSRFPLTDVPLSIRDLQKKFTKIAPLNNRYDVLDVSIALSVIDGVNLEFGVWTGDSLRYASQKFKNKQFIGFDKFENMELPHFNDNVALMSGVFEKTLNKWKEDNSSKASFVHIDADTYDPCKYVLFNINDRIVPGTVIQFDELFEFKDNHKDKWYKGEWLALAEWSDYFKRKFTPLARDNSCRASIIIEK